MADLIEYFHWNYVALIATEHSYGLHGVCLFNIRRSALDKWNT